MRRVLSRRHFLATYGLGAAALAAGCGDGQVALRDTDPAGDPDADGGATSTIVPSPSATATVVPTPTPRPAGHELRSLLAGTDWETSVSIRASGVPGPALVVLGGVHGNEPGGWLAATEVADWVPETGVLAVVPQANVLAVERFLRLVDGDGDLNRQYPGDPASEIAMSRLAAAITGLTRELQAEVLLDLHESWAFYVDREAAGFVNRQQAGTAFLGQTITGGAGPRSPGIASELAAVVNASITVEREKLIARDGSEFRRDDRASPSSTRGRSSLSLGGHVPGLTPVLVETGQQDQAVERRSQLHLSVVRATMDLLGM